MPPNDENRVVVTDGAFHYVGALAGVINTYATRQAAAETQITAALDLDKLFVGAEGAALKQVIMTGEQDITTALSDARNTTYDLTQLGLAADQALRDVSNTDEVVRGLFQPGQDAQGDPSRPDRPQFKPGTTRDSAGQPVDASETGPGSLQEEMEQAQAAAQQARAGGDR